MARWILALVLFVAPACGSGDAARRCLTDQEICEFHTGVSTTTDVHAALGAPQVSQSVGGTGGGIQQWVYICQQTAQNVDVVQFVFDQTGLLEDVSVLRSGTGVPPAPVCTN